VDVVVDHHDRGVEVAAHLLHDREERSNLAWREPGGRLVEQQHIGFERDHARQLGHAADAGRQL